MFSVLLVEPDFDDNGALRVSLDRAQRWAAMGADVTALFVSGHARGARTPVPAGLPVVVANRGMRSARYMLPAALLRGLPLARKADIVVSGREMASGLLVGTFLAKVARRPLAVTIHSNVDAALSHHATPRHRRNVLACLKTANLLTPVSRGLVPGLLQLGIAERRVQAIENGVDLGRLAALAAQGSAFERRAKPYILSLGRLIHQKGFDVLIQAHALALRQGAPEHDLVIAGEGPDRDMLAGLAERLGVAGSVVLTGFLDNPYPVVRHSSLFVVSSRWEGFSMALAEAVALDVPCVAADCVSGPREILDGGRLGDLLAVDDEAALADAIGRHLGDPGRLQSRTYEAREFVSQRYGAARAAERHLAALQQVVIHP